MTKKPHHFRSIVAILSLCLLSVPALSGIANAVAASPSAKFSATDAIALGTATTSGMTTFSTIVNDESAGITKIQYYLNGTLQGTNTKIGSYDGIQINVSAMTNGTYHLSATVSDASGDTGTVMALDGNAYLTFIVNNTITPTPPAVPSAQFTATDDNTFGSATSNNNLNFGTALTNKSAGITTVKYYLNGQLVATKNEADGSDNYQMDVSTLANGVYHLTASVSDSTGASGTVMALDGNAYLTFTVNNTVSAPPTVPTCSAKQKDIDAITTRIVQRSESQVAVIDSVATAVEKYADKQASQPTGYPVLTAKITSDQNATQDNLIQLVSDSSITCDSSGRPQLTNFKDSVSTVESSITSYHQDVQQLITLLEK